jgi:hypothetical protein
LTGVVACSGPSADAREAAQASDVARPNFRWEHDKSHHYRLQ